MESVIKWQTGVPKEEGFYILTVKTKDTFEKKRKKNGKVYIKYIDIPRTVLAIDEYYLHYGWKEKNHHVTAWCPLSEIEPYKE